MLNRICVCLMTSDPYFWLKLANAPLPKLSDPSVSYLTGWQAFHVFSAQPHLPVMVLPGHQRQLWDNPWGQEGSSWWEVFSAFDGLQRPPSLPLHRDQPQDHRGGDHGPRDLGHQLERRGRPERQNQQYGQSLDALPRFRKVHWKQFSDHSRYLLAFAGGQTNQKGQNLHSKNPTLLLWKLSGFTQCFQIAFLFCAFITKFCFTEKNT